MSHDDNIKKQLAGAKALRLTLGLTQTQMAKKVGVSQSSWSDIETGKTQNIKGSTLLGVATVLRRIPLPSRPKAGDLLWADPVSDEESEILALYRLLSGNNKNTLQQIAKTLLNAEKPDVTD